MKSPFSALVLLAITMSVGSAEFSVRGPGGTICGEYLELRESSRAWDDITLAWVQGYVTGLTEAIPEVSAYTNDADLHAMTSWIRQYCEAHPSDMIYQGTVEMVHKLKLQAEK
jgi:hypothetical protein